MITVLYQDRHITVTDAFIRPARLQDQVIPMERISGARQDRIKVGDFKGASILFIILSVISAFTIPMLLFFFIPWAIGAWFTSRYRFALIATVRGEDLLLYESVMPVNGAVRVIRTLIVRAKKKREKQRDPVSGRLF